MARTDDAVRPPAFTRYRTVILIAGMILFLPPLAFVFQATTGEDGFCGTWCPRMFFAWRSGVTGDQFLMGMARSFMGVALVAGTLLVTFFAGRYWCSHVCPVGAVMELGSRLVPKSLKIDFSTIPAAPVRYGYLAAYLIAPALGIGALCCNYCNFATVPRMFGAAFSSADLAYFFRAYGLINLALIGVLGFMAKGGRAYCNFLCPVGALDTLANKLGTPFGKRMAVDGRACNGCGNCVKECPTWAIEIDQRKAVIDQLSCLPCGLCAKACPEHAVIYGRQEQFRGEQVPAVVSYALSAVTERSARDE
ncbi:MAG: 4Fe-4S binding protein [Syntrophales bacterium]